MEQAPVGFEGDIRPLFRDKDVESMSAKFDLSSYDDVKANADRIVDKLADGLMPCDGPWPEDHVALFREWVAAGYPALGRLDPTRSIVQSVAGCGLRYAAHSRRWFVTAAVIVGTAGRRSDLRRVLAA